jgi:hypothetical protein
MPQFTDALNRQIAEEFAASQQYVAIAVWYDAETLPELARHFDRQAVEERNHAMIIVKYLLDARKPVTIPSVAEPRNDFADPVEPVRLADLPLQLQLCTLLAALPRASQIRAVRSPKGLTEAWRAADAARPTEWHVMGVVRGPREARRPPAGARGRGGSPSAQAPSGSASTPRARIADHPAAPWARRGGSARTSRCGA